MDDLVAFGLVPSLIAAARGATGSAELLPLQAQAVRAGVLDTVAQGDGDSGDFLIAAPDGAGKTALLDLCAAHAAHSARRVLIALPTPAAVESAIHRLRSRYGALGLRIGEPDQDQLDIAVTHWAQLPRLAAVLRLGDVPFLAAVDVVLIDELERLRDPDTGSALELLLAVLDLGTRGGPDTQRSQRRPRRLMFSRDVGSAEQQAQSFGVTPICATSRPHELRSGVLLDGVFTYRSSREAPPADPSVQITGEEAFPGSDALQVAIDLCERGEQLLLIAPGEATCAKHAERLARHLGATGKPPAEKALQALAQTASGRPRELLATTLRHGVAVLSSGLTPSQRALVRTALQQGEVRILCAPPESILDDDVRGRSVIVLAPWRWRRAKRGGGLYRAPLSTTELQGLAGRALPPPLGGSARAIFIAENRLQAEDLKRALWSSPEAHDPPEPMLRGQTMSELVLPLLGVGADPAEVLAQTITGRRIWSAARDRTELSTEVEAALQALTLQGLVKAGVDQRPRLSAAGAIAVRQGLGADATARLRRWAEAARGAAWIDLEALLVLSLDPEAAPAGLSEALPLHASELETQEHPIEALARIRAEGASERPLFRWLAEKQDDLSLPQVRAIKRALLLADWADRHELAVLEARYGVWAGVVQRSAERAGRGLRVLAELCAERGWSTAGIRRIDRLAERLIERLRNPEVPSSGTVERSRSVLAIRAARRAGAMLNPAPAAEHLAPPEVRIKQGPTT